MMALVREQRESPGAVLAAHGLRAKKHFGQNFLADQNLAARIAELATEPPGGTVVEIGAGLGALTRPLLERASRVVAIERDRDLLPILRKSLPSERLEILEADAKSVDLAALACSGPAPHVIAGNLPYQLTGPLLERAVASARQVDRVVVLVQLEVGERLTARPGTAAWGALSVFVQAQFSVTRAFVVRRGAFQPQPGVDSAVVVLDPLPEPAAEENQKFRELVHKAFAQRRKKLRNAWRGVFGLDDAALARAAERAGIDLDVRGETLEVVALARMSREIA